MALCLLPVLCLATFDIEDPAEPGKEVIKSKEGKSFFGKKNSKDEVIVPATTEMFLPTVENGDCTGWKKDKTESYQDQNKQTRYATNKTYIGTPIQVVDCKNLSNGNTLSLVLVQIGKDRLIWVATDQVIPTD